ncbi:MAG: SMP-30/gluconolactonase/LRE family protein [Rubrivivax sp.]|nr:SMP-30/gluconolactonase/LRE family protein [Rubrivivax sp.]
MAEQLLTLTTRNPGAEPDAKNATGEKKRVHVRSRMQRPRARRCWLAALGVVWLLCACGGGSPMPVDQEVPPGGLDGPPLALLIGNVAGGGNVDGPAAVARFNLLAWIAIGTDANLYVGDAGQGIRMITPDADVSTVDRTPTLLDWGSDGAGNRYELQVHGNRVLRIDPAGTVSVFAGSSQGYADGPAPSAMFHFCQVEVSPTRTIWFCPSRRLAVDREGNIYVPDHYNDAVRKITPHGVVSTYARVGGVIDLAIDSKGTLYATAGNSLRELGRGDVIYRIRPGGAVEPFVGTAASDGVQPLISASTDCTPWAVANDAAGALYVTGAVQPATLCRIDGKRITAVPLLGTTGQALWPGDLVVDRAGNVFVADNQRHVIRRIDPSGAVTTFAGSDQRQGDADGVGAEARFTGPNGLAIDSADNLYVTDSFSAVRKITPAAVVTTLAGTASAGPNTDGPAALARFDHPRGLAADAAGNVYVADTGHHTVRKIMPDGRVSTLAGSPGEAGSEDGTRGQARFNGPWDLAVDSEGNVYVADSGNHTIRKITPAGVVSTVIGIAGREGFIAGPLPGVISKPRRLAFHGSTLYFTTYQGVARASRLTERPPERSCPRSLRVQPCE